MTTDTTGCPTPRDRRGPLGPPPSSRAPLRFLRPVPDRSAAGSRRPAAGPGRAGPAAVRAGPRPGRPADQRGRAPVQPGPRSLDSQRARSPRARSRRARPPGARPPGLRSGRAGSHGAGTRGRARSDRPSLTRPSNRSPPARGLQLHVAYNCARASSIWRRRPCAPFAAAIARASSARASASSRRSCPAAM